MIGVGEILDAAARRQPNGHAPGGNEWGEPVPLLAEHIAPLPYPVDALSPVLRAAVATYQRYAQQPVALVACSALASASLACQALADVDRDGNLPGPCSLAFLTVAESGERKTACDKRLGRAVRAWQAERRRELAPGIAAARGRLDAWTARREGVLGRIKRLSGSTKAEDEADRRALEGDLGKLDGERPRVPPEPELFMEDVSPEALAVRLAEGWPSSSLWSDEGGLVVGSHAMGEDSAMRFLALLNRLWDGNPFSRRRTTRESVTIEGRRFTASLMVQPYVLGKLVAAGDGLARGTGALARFLTCWPESTMGSRAYREGDVEAPELAALDARLAELLAAEMPVADAATMALEPRRLRLDRGAFDVWRMFHDEVECELAARGEFAELRDFAAKAAEQAARLACVLHVFEHGPSGAIGAGSMEAGAKLAAWHLHEARRVLGLVGHSGELADATALLEWLGEQVKPPTAGDILRLGPYRVRDKGRRDRALAKLAEHHLAGELKVGKATHVVLNPALGACP